MSEKKPPKDSTAPLPEYGFLASYANTTQLVDACEKIRDAGYTRWDAYSPFPVHGIDPAMGIRPTRLPFIVMAAGLTGCGGAVLMQWWMNAIDYAYLISGKPLWSLAANIPVAFELTILLSALCTFFGVLAMNGLPSWFHPLFRSKKFASVTDDSFFIAIEARDPRFDAIETKRLLESTQPATLEIVEDETEALGTGSALPKGVVYAGAIITALAIIPLCFVLRAYSFRTPHPRIHVVHNMDNQTRFKAQQTNYMFTDGRAMRPAIAGTVATGQSRLDDHYWRGMDAEGNWVTTFPDQISIDEATIRRGQERFNIYCSTCHGYNGKGEGMVHQRASSLDKEKTGTTWVPPTNMHLEYVKLQPHGKLFNTISNGVRNMYGYGHLIEVDDRWAIVAYIRALQLSQDAPLGDVPSNQRAQLR